MKKTILTLFAVLFCIAAGAKNKAEENPLANVSQQPGYCSIIHNWGFIGDSLCSGEAEYIKPDGKKGYRDIYEYSWGQRMCALMGVHGTNYSKGGETTKGWIEHFWDHSFDKWDGICAKDRRHQAYIIALGVNDCGKLSNPTGEWEGWKVGSVADDVNTGDYTKNAVSFSGCYAGIIQRVKSIQPQAKFFLVTMPREDENAKKVNETIRDMAKVFSNVYIIDLEKYALEQYAKDSQWRKDHFAYGHLSPAGYEYTAWMFMTYIDWIIRHNMDDFRYVSLIGTDLV